MDNAIYTPSPTAIAVTVYRSPDGEIRATTTPDHLIDGDVIRTETAAVFSRGNLTSRGTHRWHGVELTDGTRHYVLIEGS